MHTSTLPRPPGSAPSGPAATWRRRSTPGHHRRFGPSPPHFPLVWFRPQTTMALAVAFPATKHDVLEDPPESPSVSGPTRSPAPRWRWRRWLWLLAILVVARIVSGISLAPLAAERLSRVNTRVVADSRARRGIGFGRVRSGVPQDRACVGPLGGPQETPSERKVLACNAGRGRRHRF